MRQDKSCSRSACGTDGPEEIGAFKTLVGWLARPRSAPRPLAHNSVLLADPRLVLEPNLNWRCLWYIGEMSAQCA